MTVKQSKSGARVLSVLEEIAAAQPVGVSELSRRLQADKSAVQRAIMTLAGEGWIWPTPDRPVRWQLTGHIQAVAHMALSRSGLRQRSRPAMEALRDATGETVSLTAPDVGRFVVIDVVESRQLVRAAPNVGMVVLIESSATGRVVLAHLPREEQIRLLGREPDAGLEQEFELARRQGYFASEDPQAGGSVNVAAPIFEANGRPVGSVLVSIPAERLAPEDYARVGALVAKTARELSLARPPAPPQAAA
jgi:IclR family acetate operon transcriptional repressor